MKKMMSALSCAAALMLAPVAAFAEYPERPINMIIAYGPGGATDISARTISGPLGDAVGQPLVMSNVAGAGGATGSAVVQNASADGYTMLFARSGSHSVNPAMKATLPYKVEDFRYVTVYEINPVACVVNTNSGIETIDQLIDKVKAGEITYSSSGVGAVAHLVTVKLFDIYGVEDPANAAIHIPLKGGGPAATAVLNDTADMLCTNSSSLAGFVANGQMRPLLVTTLEPVAGFDAPTAKDLGKPELSKLVGWTGIAGPKELPDDIAAKWAEWVDVAISDPEFVEQMTSRGSKIVHMSTAESEVFIQEQYQTFRDLVDKLGIRIEG